MKRHEVIVDSTAIVAALDPDDPDHPGTRAALTDLVARTVSDAVILVTHTDAVTGSMAELARRGAPQHVVDSVPRLAEAFDVEVLHRDLMVDAEAVQELARQNGVELGLRSALVVELARRRRTRQVLSLDAALDQVDLVRLT